MRRIFLAVGLSLLAATASAQDAGSSSGGQDRRGVWVSLGAGGGSRGLACDNCSGDRQLGFATSLRVGATLSPQVTLGANLVGWITSLSADQGGSVGVFTALMGVVQYYPIRQRGLYVQGGGGYIVDVLNSESVVESPGIIAGAGYDVPLRKGLSLTPHINYLRSIDGGNQVSSLIQIGVGLTWH